MSTVRIRDRVPARYGAVALAATLASLAYAVITAHVLAWLLWVLAAASLGLGLFGIYLFYRLVVAVERIADDR